MRASIFRRILTIGCTIIIALCLLTQGVFAANLEIQPPVLDQQDPTEPTGATEPTDSTDPTDGAESEEDENSGILDAITSLPDQFVDGIVDGLVDTMDSLSNAAMNGITKWTYSLLLSVAEMIISYITSTSSSIFDFPWFRVIVGLFSKFGMLLFAVGVVLTFVDVGIEYRRRGIDLSGVMLNLGKGLMAVGLFSTVPVPLFNFCVHIQSVILHTLAIDWSFQSIIDALYVQLLKDGIMTIMLVIMIVLIFLIYLDSLKRGGILLVLICIGSLHMISVPRGYLDNFYSWCKQVIALCLTVLFQNLLLFCGLMIVPTNIFLGLGVMFAAKEVPRICAQFGLDTSVKTSFTNIAMGANASVQAVKAASVLLA